MIELTILQQIFLVSYSILFGIMLNTTMGLGLFFFGWIWDREGNFNWRPFLRVLASLFFINFIPFVYFALIYDWLGAFQNDPTFGQIFGTFLLALYVFGIYRIFHLIIKKFRNYLYGTEINECKYSKVRERLASIGPSDLGHLLAIVFYIGIALWGAFCIAGTQAFFDLKGWFELLFARANWAVFIILFVAFLICVLIGVSRVLPNITHLSFRRFKDLTVKWGAFLGMLFFSGISVDILKNYYLSGNKGLIEIAFLFIMFIILSLALGLLAMFYPPLQRQLDATFGEARARVRRVETL